uniref:Chromosome 18 open reading frame 54 n=1 Tax=Xenopus tropicalis TaxID=8364 RepID=F6QZ73_XENTR
MRENMEESVSPNSSASISSLLASCSLSGTGRFSRSRQSVRYKDRLYDSASRALEDYIRDYEEGLQATGTKAGKTAGCARLNQSVKERGDSIDLLLQKSEDADISQTEVSSPLHFQGSPQTEEILEAERSWENNPYPVKPPVPVICQDSDLGIFSQSKSVEDIAGLLTKDYKSFRPSASTFSGGNHHGPVEALKHMLYNLQAFQHSFTQGKTTDEIKEINKVSKEAGEDLRHLDQEMFPVNKSLQKALHHLARLKELVGDTSMEQYKEKNGES